MPRNIPNVATTGFFDAFTGTGPGLTVPQRDANFNNSGVGTGSSGPSVDIYGSGSPTVANPIRTTPISQAESDASRGFMGLLGGAIGGKYGSLAGALGSDAANGKLTGKMVGDTVLGAALPGYSIMNTISKFASDFDANRPNDAGGPSIARPYVKTISDGLFGTDARYNPYTGQLVKGEAGVTGDWGADVSRYSLGDTTMQEAKRLAGDEGDAIGYFGQMTGGWNSPNVGYSLEANKMPGDPLDNLMQLTDAYGTSGGNTRSDSLAAQANAMPGDAMSNLMSVTGAFGTAPSGGSYQGTNGVNGGDAGGNTATTGPSLGGGTGSWSSPSGGGFGGYADGGQVGLTGPMYGDVNQAPASLAQMGFASGGGVGLGAPGGSMGPEQMQSQLAQMVRDPRTQQVVQQMVGAAMQSGELTPEELITVGRIAEASMHNPSLYPQLRQFAVQNGMSPLPEAFDPRVILTLMAASKIMGRTQPGQVPPTDVAQMQNPNGMSNGGFLQGPGTGRSDSIGTVEQTTGKPVKVANGEYVIPKHVVDAKGKDFFDKMLRQYAQLTPQE